MPSTTLEVSQYSSPPGLRTVTESSCTHNIFWGLQNVLGGGNASSGDRSKLGITSSVFQHQPPKGWCLFLVLLSWEPCTVSRVLWGVLSLNKQVNGCIYCPEGRLPGRMSAGGSEPWVGFVNTTRGGGGFAVSWLLHPVLVLSLWLPNCAVNTLFPWPSLSEFVLSINEHLLQGATQFPTFESEKTREHDAGGTARGSVAGKPVLFTASTAVGFACWLPWIGCITFLNLDTSSMETYYIYIYIFCLRRAVFSIAQILTASN